MLCLDKKKHNPFHKKVEEKKCITIRGYNTTHIRQTEEKKKNYFIEYILLQARWVVGEKQNSWHKQNSKEINLKR